jgi:hypothetical protein
MSDCISTKCDRLGVCNCPAAGFQDPDDCSPARDVAPDYMSCWDWIGQALQAGVAAAVAIGLVATVLGFAYGRWVL